MSHATLSRFRQRSPKQYPCRSLQLLAAKFFVIIWLALECQMGGLQRICFSALFLRYHYVLHLHAATKWLELRLA